MKERPIIFSDPMVRAILEGRKTMTRRVIKAGVDDKKFVFKGRFSDGRPGFIFTDSDNDPECLEHAAMIACPYGYPGDRIWVRESWATSKGMDGRSPCSLKDTILPYWYRADDYVHYLGPPRGPRKSFLDRGVWRSPIHMPREIARIVLEITDIRVERVQDIGEMDAVCEGAVPKFWGYMKQVSPSLFPGGVMKTYSARYDFYEIWQNINASRGFGWDANPWVWVVEFKKV